VVGAGTLSTIAPTVPPQASPAAPPPFPSIAGAHRTRAFVFVFPCIRSAVALIVCAVCDTRFWFVFLHSLCHDKYCVCMRQRFVLRGVAHAPKFLFFAEFTPPASPASPLNISETTFPSPSGGMLQLLAFGVNHGRVSKYRSVGVSAQMQDAHRGLYRQHYCVDQDCRSPGCGGVDPADDQQHGRRALPDTSSGTAPGRLPHPPGAGGAARFRAIPGHNRTPRFVTARCCARTPSPNPAPNAGPNTTPGLGGVVTSRGGWHDIKRTTIGPGSVAGDAACRTSAGCATLVEAFSAGSLTFTTCCHEIIKCLC
jgi:hypothetical protein